LEKDGRFLESILGNILTETEKLGCAEQGPSEERYIIYSNAFDKIIEYVSAYKNILTSIKQEYKAFITRIKNGQRNAFFLRGRLKALESESTALLYYRKRAMELEDKIKAIEKNSAKIKNEILKIQNIGKAKPIPGLSVEESLSLDYLSKHLAQLNRWLLELKKDGDGKYIPHQKKTELEQELLHLLAIRDAAEAKREKLKLRISLVANAISACAKSDKTITLQNVPSQITKNDERALDVPSKVAEDSLEYFESELFSSGQYDAAATCAINSPGGILCNEEALKNLKSLDARGISPPIILSSILGSGRRAVGGGLREEGHKSSSQCTFHPCLTTIGAAFLARPGTSVAQTPGAASIISISFQSGSKFFTISSNLRATASGSSRYPFTASFQESSSVVVKALSCLEGRNLPSLKYFDTLINASTAAGHLPNLPVTLEAIKYALSEKQLNLVNHWVTQQRLTFSEAVRDVIYDYGKEEPNNMSECLALAQAAYGHSGAYKKVVLCLCKQGRIAGAADYIQQVEHFSLDDYFFLLENCPSTALIRCLSQQWIRKPPFSSMGATILSFISAKHKKHGFQLLEEMNNKNALEQIILSDTVSTWEDWNKIAVICAENKHEKLSQKIVSVLTSQDGVFDNSQLEDEKDTRIME
ncbi:clathrin heavy chain linker domain-containing protein 1, partial [Cygnus atratus]|uniref:clathrin heavy chain linker domain-containing protein 1 n=1 Tax=Cygnus atratus TaxID=8868 RepID=UPI0021B732CF